MNGRLSLLLLALMSTLAGPAWTAEQQRYALVIGNAAYPSAPLGNPVNDATDMAAKLKQRGFQVTRLLDAGKRQMEEAIYGFTRLLTGTGKVGVFYYAGHGLEIGGDNYLVPVDAVLRDETDGRYNTVNAGKLLDRMNQAGNGLNLVILDACRNNPFKRGWRGVGTGLAQMQPAAGTLILYATEPRKEAADGSGRNGIFTQYLLTALDQPGVQVEDAFKEVSAKVMQETGGQQIPWLEGVIHGHFYFLGPVRIQVAPQPTPGVDTEVSLWLAMQRCGTAACLHAYLDSYPSGRFAAAAKALLASLTPSPAPVPPTPDPAVRLKDELALCRRHLEANRLTTGIGGTALDCYRGVLSQDPANAEALAGLEAIVSRYLGWAEGLLAQRRFDPAAEYLAKAAGILPESPAVRALQARLEAARRPGGPPPPWERLPAAIRPRRRSRVPGRGRMPLPQPWATAWSGSRRAVFRWAARPRSRGEAMTRNSTGCA